MKETSHALLVKACVMVCAREIEAGGPALPAAKPN
jgi:hypothetical protein